MGRSAHPYDDTAVIDSRAPRTNQAFIGSLALLAFVVDAQWLIALLAIQLLVGLRFGRRYCLPCVIYFELIQPRIGEGRLEDSRPPRFANQMGAGFLGVATIAFLAGASTFGWVLALIVAALALFAAMSGVCVGCEIYVQIARARGTQVDRYPV
jgi:ribosomal protein S26